MNYRDKELLFNAFLEKWESQFNKIPSILQYLSTYPEIIEKIEDFHLIGADDTRNSQLEWVSLVAQFDRPTELNFFKSFWVPIQSDHYAYFIDLSSEKYPIFEIKYFHLEPYRWYKKYITQDLSQFLAELDNKRFNFDEYLEVKEEDALLIVNRLYDERDLLGFRGEIQPRPISRNNFIPDALKYEYVQKGDQIIFKGVNSLIVGLLPYDMEITLESFTSPFNRSKDIFEKVKDIRGLVYLLQSVGELSVEYFSFKTNNIISHSCIFKKNKFILASKQQVLLKKFINKTEEFLKDCQKDS